MRARAVIAVSTERPARQASKLKRGYFGTSPVAQGLRIRLLCRRPEGSVAGAGRPTYYGAAKAVGPQLLSLGSRAGSCSPRARGPPSPSSAARGAPAVRSLTLHPERRRSPQLEKALTRQPGPAVIGQKKTATEHESPS